MLLANHTRQTTSLSPMKIWRTMAFLLFLCIVFQLNNLQFTLRILENNPDILAGSFEGYNTQQELLSNITSTEDNYTFVQEPSLYVPASLPTTDSQQKVIDFIITKVQNNSKSNAPVANTTNNIETVNLALHGHIAESIEEAEFLWTDIDYDSSDCGQNKCFFPSKMQPNKTGYLVARDIGKDAWRAWNISQSIDRILKNTETNNTLQHQTRYHYYSPKFPWTFKNISQTLAKNLGKGHAKKKFYIGNGVTVQQVDVAPRSELRVLRCKNDGRNRLVIESNFFTPTGMLSSIEARETVKKVRQSLQKTILVLKVHPDLISDFQILINRQGEIYHFDLDRHYGANVTKKRLQLWLNKCQRQLHDFAQELEDYLLHNSTLHIV